MKAHGLNSFADLETLFEQRLLDMLSEQNTSYIVRERVYVRFFSEYKHRCMYKSSVNLVYIYILLARWGVVGDSIG